MDIPTSVAQLLLLGGLLTGSRAFEVAKPDSDWDIVIYEDQVPSWIHDHPTYSTCSSIERDSDPDQPRYNYNIFGHSLIDITRVTLEDGTNINLFEFDRSIDIIPKFRELNRRMLKLSSRAIPFNTDISIKENRVQAFIDLCIDLDIAEPTT